MSKGITGWRLSVIIGAGVLALLCVGPLALIALVMDRLDGDYGEYSKPDPLHLGHTDVFLVDPVDRVIRGHVVADYDGRFANDPRWQLRLRDVEEEIPAAICDVRNQLGLGDRPVPPFMVRFRDDEQVGWRNFMSTFQELHGTEVRPLIVVGVNSLLTRECDIASALRHEIAHCWQLAALGEAFYDLPHWVKEGLADWATGNGSSRLHWLYVTECETLNGAPSAGLVNGIEGGISRVDYGEYYLAFAFIEETFGKGAVHQFVSEVFTHTSYQVSIQRITKLPFPVFEGRARAWATEYVRRELTDRPAYLAGKEAFRKGEYEKADRAYSSYLGGKEPLHFRLVALLEQAECRVENGDAVGARRALDLAEVAVPVGPLKDRILHDRVRVAALEEDWAQVEALSLSFLDDFTTISRMRTDTVRRLLKESRERRSKATGDAPAPPPGTSTPPSVPVPGAGR